MDKNLKDDKQNRQMSYGLVGENLSFTLSYRKSNKLITGLYMVTDMIEKEEPIRNKLRTLGTEIISDIHNSTSTKTVLSGRIDQIMSFLEIATAMNFISEMNCNILTKEFLKLRRSVDEYKEGNSKWLTEFFTDGDVDSVLEDGADKSKGHAYKGHLMRNTNYKGHTRIGVQKGGTLMKALSDRIDAGVVSNAADMAIRRENFSILKKQRRDSIISIIKKNSGSATIKDIKTKVSSESQGLVTYSEKTLQRELMSMIRDGVLYKTGEKRWTQYLIKD